MALADGEHCGGFCKAFWWPAPSRLASFFPCVDFFQSSVTLRLLYSPERWELALPIFFFLLMLCLFFFFSFKATSDLKGQFSLLSVGLSSMARSRKGYPLQCVFHHLNPISGSRRSLPCQVQFAASPEAWGRGPSRRRVILRTQPSRRNECLVLRLCVPSVPLSERQEHSRGRQRALQ